MIYGRPLHNLSVREQQAQQHIAKDDYIQAADYYKQAIEAEPEVKSHYWNLGLILLLQGQESQAQAIWKSSLAKSEAQAVEQLTTLQMLLQILADFLNNSPLHPALPAFLEASLAHIEDRESFINILIPATIKIAHSIRQPQVAVRLLEIGSHLEPRNIDILRYLASFYINAGNYAQGIETAKLCFSLSEKLPAQLYAIHLLQRGLMEAPDSWQEAYTVQQQQESLLQSLFEQQPPIIEASSVSGLFTTNYFAPYLRDDARRNRQIQNQISQVCQFNVQHYNTEQAQRYRHRGLGDRKKLVKIGYLSHCLCIHSVGWLARWLFQYHDRTRFQIHAYFINYKQGDPLQQWYAQQATQAYKGGINSKEIAEKIYQDEIDILIDLDSITVDMICEIIGLKPAPVQATWLGSDASGLPAVDYFIADPYVLPESAQDYYAEKIWRLPQTYIAVDGFEVGVPTLRREHLDIPSDAVIYLSAQRGFKRHPQTARLQMQIIKEVPNSYFLIKGFADAKSVQNFFVQLAEQEGVGSDRLRFLPPDPTEAVHRANLAIADVVLDTYPYNGATTTLETLWMGIPIVTKVGLQFAARNSYTMMVNAGIEEGIAWTDDEYVEWGVRLGKDAALRQQISWKLRQSRQNAPLWNGKQFAREMEKAYEQMWQRHENGE